MLKIQSLRKQKTVINFFCSIRRRHRCSSTVSWTRRCVKETIIYVSNALTEIEQAHDRILVFHDGRILMDGHLDKLLESTLDYHQFQVEFINLTDDLYKNISNVATVVSPNRLDNIFHFYGRTRTVFFDVIRAASNELMVELNVKKVGLRDLLDSEFAGKGLD